MTLAARSNSGITLDPNGGTSTKLILDSAWSRSVGAGLLIDYSSPSAGSREVVTADATTGIVLSNGIYGSILVRDSAGVTGFATRVPGSGQPSPALTTPRARRWWTTATIRPPTSPRWTPNTTAARCIGI